nr:MAG TPA: hypothetical protein [Caudoviricetes sp.]DAV99833.1 MAG TPA: hypothetical protein [Caudoviricetes sp.]
MRTGSVNLGDRCLFLRSLRGDVSTSASSFLILAQESCSGGLQLCGVRSKQPVIPALLFYSIAKFLQASD